MSDMKKFFEGGPETRTLNVQLDVRKDSAHQRVVIGFATLDNVDLSDDIVTAEASMKAFEKFRGNVRLMHEPDPVGRVVGYQPATYFDPETNKEYQGIQVAVRISEARDDVWKMVLDGTLSGFSIGGRQAIKNREYREELGKSVNVITGYDLTELSLVDSPANHLANVSTIYKSIDSRDDEPFGMYGSFQKVIEIETKGEHPTMPEEAKTTPAEVDEVSTETTETAKEETKVETPAEEPAVEPEKVEAATEEEKPEEKVHPSLEEVIAQLSEQIAQQTEKVGETVSKSVGEAVALKVDDIKQEFDSRLADLEKAAGAFDAPIGELKDRIIKLEESIGETQKRLDAVSSNTAIKKSVDAEPAVTETEPASVWGGVFSDRYA